MSVTGNIPSELGAETVSRTVASESATVDSLDRPSRPLPIVAGYRIVRRLGGGGMGDVYEAIDEKLGVTFALKMIRPDKATAAFIERFRNEMRSMMLLDHPHIARIFGHSESAGQPFFTMKYVRGGTLADRRTSFVDRPREAVSLLIKVIDAVGYLHKSGKVHRDLKPSNILLDEAGQPFLSDFGLVKDLSDLDEPASTPDQAGPAADTPLADAETRTEVPGPGRLAKTRTGAQIGTYAYMSPEQLRGEVRRIGPASDIWALGIILRELVTGERPHLGESSETTGTAGPRALDPALVRIIDKCLSPELEQRYQSTEELAADLRKWLDRPRVRARRRMFAVSAAILLIGTVTVYAAVSKWGKRDPAADWRSWARGELRAGRPVTLVDAEGNAAPSVRLVGGLSDSKMDRDPEGWWTVRTVDAALVEFLDDPGVDEFTLSGQVRTRYLAGLASAGLYVGHRQVRGVDGDVHFQFEYLYDENVQNILRGPPQPQPPPPPIPPGPKAKLFRPKRVELVGSGPPQRLVRLHASTFVASRGIAEMLHSRAIGRDDPTDDGPWRNLAIHAHGETFIVEWQGREEYSISEIPADRLVRMQRLLTELPDPPLRFTARGGLGVYVDGGSASFRNLTVTPGP